MSETNYTIKDAVELALHNLNTDDEYRINLTFISEIIITFIMYYKIYRKRISKYT